MALAAIAVGLALGLAALFAYGFQPSISATKEYAQSMRADRKRAQAQGRPYVPPAQTGYSAGYPPQQPGAYPPSLQGAPPGAPPPTAAPSPRFQPASAPAAVAVQPAPTTDEPVDKDKEREAAEIERLRQMKVFDPFNTSEN